MKSTNDGIGSKSNGKKRTNGKRNASSRQRKPYSNGKRNSDDIQGNEDQHLQNDPSWYFTDVALADQVSSISYDSFIGIPNTVTAVKAEEDGSTTNFEVSFSMGGVMALYVNPSAGTGFRPGLNGLDQACRKMYTTLSSVNAKTTNYDPTDLGILMLCLGSLIEYVEFLRRAFGIMFTYNVRNRLMPKALIYSMGINYDEFASKLADYRIQFNTLIATINKIPFLSNITWFQKCASMYTRVLKDSDSDMAQLYLMNPNSMWIFDEKSSSTGSVAKASRLPGYTSPVLFSEHLDLLSAMVTALLTSTTLNYIYADVINYSTKNNSAQLLYLPLLEEQYGVVPEYDIDALQQIHNATWYGSPSDDTQSAYANVNSLTISYVPVVEYQNPRNLLSSLILDANTPSTSVAQRVDYSRYATIGYETMSDDMRIFMNYVAIPDHFVTNVRIYPNSEGSIDTPLTINSNMYAGDVNPAWLSLSHFDWAPYLYLNQGVEGAGFVLGDTNYFTWNDVTWYQRVADIAMIGLFDLR